MRDLVCQRSPLLFGVELSQKPFRQHYLSSCKGKRDHTRLARGEPYRRSLARGVAQRFDRLTEMIGIDERLRADQSMEAQEASAEPDQADRSNRQP